MKRFDKAILSELLNENKLSQGQLARMAQVTPACIHYLLTADRDPTGKTINAISEALGVESSIFYREVNANAINEELFGDDCPSGIPHEIPSDATCDAEVCE